MNSDLKRILDDRIVYRSYLYTKGFLVTDDVDVHNVKDCWPFYANWHCESVGKFHFWTHVRQKLFLYYENNDFVFFMIGHAYDPFSMSTNETAILKSLSAAKDNDRYFQKLSDLTGIFITGYVNGDELFFCGDATCAQASYYGIHHGHFYLSSHACLLEDICGVTKSEYVKELIHYPHYQLFGIMLPGDLSPYHEFLRTVPNFQYHFFSEKVEFLRFWPLQRINTVGDYRSSVLQAATILKNNLCLISQKYPNKSAAISMTGGVDSKTTLSCANGIYDCFGYFSFQSTDEEKADLIAAGSIAEILGLQHIKYNIPREDFAFPDIGIWKQIIDRNTGEIGQKHPNDYRKRVYFVNHHDFDVEVKSWASEIARAYYYKRFAKEAFPIKVTPRYMTSMYKVFTVQRNLVRKTDRIFRGYLEKYCSGNVFDYIEWPDLLFWEYRFSAWNGLSTSHEHILSYDITIPYNNRRLLECFLQTPIEARIRDVPHTDIQILMNPQIAQCGISVTNVKHTSKRAKLERLYLDLNTFFSF